MLKLYRVLPDETTVVYSQRQADKTVIVHLERPTEHGFDSARIRLGILDLFFKNFSPLILIFIKKEICFQISF